MNLVTGDTSLFMIKNDSHANYKQLFQDLDNINKGIYKIDTLAVSQLKKYFLLSHTEAIFLELNLRKTKWLICYFCNSYKNLLSEQLQELAIAILFYLKDFEHFFLIDDCNAKILETNMSFFVKYIN